MYEYKTVVQDVVPDPIVQQTLDNDLNLLCREGGWEVKDVAVIVHPYLAHNAGEDIIIQKVYTLRRSIIKDEDGYCIISIRTPAKHIEAVQNFARLLKD